MTGQSLLTNIVVARSQGATSFIPAFVGALTRFPMPSLIFTLLLARREREAQQPPDTGGVRVTIPLVKDTDMAVAFDKLSHLGLAVTLVPKHDDTFDKGVAIDTNPPEGSNVLVGSSVNLIVSLGPTSPLTSP
jgi:PASTA domain